MKNISRRAFLRDSGSLAGSSWLALRMPAILAAGQVACTARESQAAFRNLTPLQGRELTAIAAEIMPATDTPGATEVGVIYFIDEALGGFMAGARNFLEQGLEDFLAAHNGSFAKLPAEGRISALVAIEQESFFQLVRMLTVAGMFCMPSRGGNQQHLGWQMINFDHRHAWQPPFGYYDASEGNKND